MILYRKVSCSERLPGVDEYYTTNDGDKYFYSNGSVFVEWDDSPTGMVEWWLDPIQLPTDEEIESGAWGSWEEDAQTNPNPNNPHAYVYGFKKGFKAALKLLTK